LATPSKTRGNVDPVAHQIAVVLLHDVAQMNADPELDAAVGRQAGVALGQAILHLDGAANGVDHAAEFDKAAVAGSLELAPSPIRDRLHRRLQPFRHLHDCSGCFRLERSPGGLRTHWKAPPSHGARKERSFADGVIFVAAGSWHFLGANRTASVATTALTPVAANTGSPAEAAHLSIVVLPFANLSGEPSQDYFVDGITDNLTTDLARIKGSFVIARNTAFTYKGKNVDAKEIGRQLGVRYVLEGSVQRDQNQVRVNAQLIDAESGAHLWAERFQENLGELFKLQDQVVARLANTLGFELVKAEAEKSAHSRSPDIVDLDMRGWVMIQQWFGDHEGLH
jgi:TolB-like protein